MRALATFTITLLALLTTLVPPASAQDAGEPPDAGFAPDDASDGPGTRTPPPPPSATPTAEMEAIRAVIRRHLVPVRRCYKRALKDHPTLQGHLSPRFTIGPDGAVTVVDLHAEGMPPELVRCVEAALKAMKFPAPADGGSVEIRYPLLSPGVE